MFLSPRTAGMPVVDDSDHKASISYQGTLYVLDDDNLEVVHGTGHKTHTVGSTATLIFTGTSVAVYSTISSASCSSPKSTFTLDDFTPTRITCGPSAVIAAEGLYQHLLYQSPTLLDGKHHLVVTHIDNDTGSSLCLEFLLYLPSSSPEISPTLPPPQLEPPPAAAILAIRDLIPLTQDDAGVVIVDDTDLLSIFYKGSWGPGGDPSAEYNHTTHGASTPGSTATFIFAGTRVAVYGTILNSGIVPNPPVSSYTIDDTPPAFFTARPTNITLTQQSYYQSPILKDGRHTLVVNLTNDSSFWLDFFLYMPSPSSSATLPSHSPSVHQNVNIGAIVGSVVGGTVIVIGVVAFWFINKRRKRRNMAGGTVTTGSVMPVQITGSVMNDVGGNLNHYHINYYGQSPTQG